MTATILIIAMLVTCASAQAQILRNLNFEQACDTAKTGLCNWELSWGAPGACTLDTYEGNQCLAIKGQDKSSVGFVEQTVLLDTATGLQILELSARVKSDGVEGKGAGINLGVYDSADQFLTNKDMGYAAFNWINGSRDRSRYTIAMVCPTEAARIKIGAILYGKGKVLFDDFVVTVTPVAGRTPSQLSRDYIAAACDSIAMHSLMRDSVDLAACRETALQVAGPAQSTKDCHLAIEYLLASLGDHHSFLMKPEEVEDWQDDDAESANIEFAKSEIIDNCGFISVPPFHGGNEQLKLAYSDSLQTAIRRLDNSPIKGWIIDLRENTGGNMTPMIAGLGPLLDSGGLGFLVNVNGERESWRYQDGAYFWETEELMRVTDPVRLSVQRPIAVLISARTGSSGEIVTISFVGNTRTRLFGQPTWGLTTGNGSFDLPDGARMMLSSTIMADRSGRQYYGRIEPDETIEPGGESEADAEIAAAIRWILSQ